MTHVNIGDKIRINYMKDEPQMTGVEGTVRLIDDMGQIHGTWSGLAIVPDMDEYEVIERAD
jgi:hypothetical protein